MSVLAQSMPMENPSQPNPSILIVEDDIFLGGILTKKLEKKGVAFALAQTGEEALVKAKEHKPRLILLDLILPKMDGFEVLEQLKADADLAEIPVIVFSNLGREEEKERAFALGAKDFVVKAQTTLDDLVEVIHHYI